ncbi:hypothetical protein [Microtetraspora malaysiensis]|uniref:Uncharacterized protein n=1 Tax=Microtetraspora malaysiensis TaxID=161358 RepID=A0ABW6T8E4_9ACTN
MPGLEPVWCYWLRRLRIVTIAAVDQALVDALAARPPADHFARI